MHRQQFLLRGAYCLFCLENFADISLVCVGTRTVSQMRSNTL